MAPSVSPNEFFEMHRYVMISLALTDFIVNFINILYVLSTNSVSYLVPVNNQLNMLNFIFHIYIKKKNANIVS